MIRQLLEVLLKETEEQKVGVRDEDINEIISC
jgi:hypothetical protein